SLFEKKGWLVVRSTGSFSPVDLVCIKKKKIILVQIKSSSKKVLYQKEVVPNRIEGIKTILVVDFGRYGIKVTKSKKKIKASEGIKLEEYLEKLERKNNGPVA
ncbi:MAG: hypothetical protein FGF47_00240, partial [Candidatus Brockarchaeota archaeon]|nr:hypothetical protein [Candidatus Brockarchaeota archaeon]